jgi:hypothetical protein
MDHVLGAMNYRSLCVDETRSTQGQFPSFTDAADR